MTTGIIMMAFGKPSYYQMAYNLALSIRFFDKDIPIQLVHDDQWGIVDDEKWVFTHLTKVDKEDLFVDGKFSPGKAKTRIDKYLMFDNNIYLDVDGICLKPIAPLIEQLSKLDGYFYSQTAAWMTPGGKTPKANLKRDGNNFPEMQWATLETIWEFHKLKDDAEVVAINSSFMYLKRGAKLTKFYDQVRDNIDNGIPIDRLAMPWGNTYPDELAYNIACAQFKVDPFAGVNPVMFQYLNPLRDIPGMHEKYYFLGLYGGIGFTHVSAWEYSDRLLRVYHKELGLLHKYKWHYLVKDKHAGKTKLLVKR